MKLFQKKSYKILLCLACLIAPVLSEAVSALYLEGDLGYATQNGLPDALQAAATSLDEHNFGYRGAIGYNHDFSNLFGLGLEAGLGKYGDAQYNYANAITTTVKSANSEFLLVSTFHFSPVDIFLKVGEVRQRMEVTGFNAPATGSQIQPEAAIGGAYNFSRHIAATLTYAHVFGDQVAAISDLGGVAPSLNEVLFGLRFTFANP